MAGSCVEAAKQEVASIAERMAADLRGIPAAAAAVAKAAIVPQDVSLVRDLLRWVPAEEVQKACAPLGLAPEEVVTRTNALLSKFEAHAGAAASQAPVSPAVLPLPVAPMAPAAALTIDEVLAYLPVDALDSAATGLFREKLLAEQAAKRQRSS